MKLLEENRNKAPWCRFSNDFWTPKPKQHNKKINKWKEPPRCQKNKTWSSPSSQRYYKITSTCGITPTEHLLNAGRRPQTSKKARILPHNWVGQKKKYIYKGTWASMRELWRKKSFQYYEVPSLAETGGRELWSFRGECSVQEAKWQVLHRESVPIGTL